MIASEEPRGLLVISAIHNCIERSASEIKYCAAMESNGKPGGLSNPAFLPDDEVRGYPPPPYSQVSRPENFPDGAVETSSQSSDGNTDSTKSPSASSGMSKSQILLLVALSFSNFLSLGCSSLHAPFYPKVVRCEILLKYFFISRSWRVSCSDVSRWRV